MIDVDTGKLARYLQPDSKKLAAKGVESVRSRVVNLASLNSRVTVETLSIALVEAFSEACGTPAKPLDPARLDECNIEQRRARFASHAWIFGHTAPFNHALGDRFAWGNLDIELASIFSDALDAEFIARLSDSLEGCRYDKDGIGKCLEALEPETDEQQTMRADCLGLFRSDF